jgi:hypothetical protein
MQPRPVKNEGGDCFACALMAILCHLFPESPPSFDEVFNYFVEKYANSDKTHVGCVWFGFKNAVDRAKENGVNIEIKNDFIQPKFNPEIHTHCFWTYSPVHEWSERLEKILTEGWIAVSAIDYGGNGPVDCAGRINQDNHFIVIDGCKCIKPQNTGMWRYEAHVVCSVKGDYWIDTNELLRKHGAAALWLIRRNK